MPSASAEAVGATESELGSARAGGLLRHPLQVSVVAAAMAGLAFTRYPVGSGAAAAALLTAVVVVVAVTDLERRIIPNRVVLPATAAVLIMRIAASPGRAEEYVIAAVLAGLLFLIPNLVNRSLLGMGDVKLAVLLGAGLGWAVAGALLIAYLLVFPVALAALLRGGLAARKTSLPFGPFLAAGALVVIMFPGLLMAGGA